MERRHLVFFDGECPLCNRSVRTISAVDRKKVFYFAPLQGKTAHQKLPPSLLKKMGTLILIQDEGSHQERQWVEGKAVLRIGWLLGGKYALLGWLSFLPSFLFDVVYRAVAKNRHRFFKVKIPMNPLERLLP